jgi:bacterioferritin-associated ferredoxin
MILCLCGNVNEQEWAHALRDSGHDFYRAQQACGAGQCCGVCLPSLQASAVPSASRVTLILPMECLPA